MDFILKDIFKTKFGMESKIIAIVIFLLATINPLLTFVIVIIIQVLTIPHFLRAMILVVLEWLLK